MTTLREAATQALEALEDFGMKHYENTGEVLHRDVYESLKAALVEDAMQKFTDVSQEIEAALAEPVAWSFEARHIDTAFGPAVSIRHPGREHKYMRNVKPLYTSPPQRKPLSEDEIAQAMYRADAIVTGPMQFRFAREIERAHGIT